MEEKDHRVFMFKAADFNQMTFNMHKSKNPTKDFPIFSNFPEFKVEVPGISKDQLLRYIGFVYDPQSPMRERITDIPSRKFNAWFYAGMKMDSETSKFRSELIAISQGIDSQVNSMIFRFCRTVKSADYAFLVGLEDGYAKMIEQGLDDAKKMDNAERMRAKIEEYQSRVLAYDNSLQLKEDFFDYVVEERMNLRPEDVARTMRDNKDPIPTYFNPYNLSERKTKWTCRKPELKTFGRTLS